MNADELIARMEQETGQRIDANDGNNLAMAGLFGAMERMMGKTPPSYTERDDVAAGVLLRHKMSPAGRQEEESNRLMAEMLAVGMSPDTLGSLFGKK